MKKQTVYMIERRNAIKLIFELEKPVNDFKYYSFINNKIQYIKSIEGKNIIGTQIYNF